MTRPLFAHLSYQSLESWLIWEFGIGLIMAQFCLAFCFVFLVLLFFFDFFSLTKLDALKYSLVISVYM